MKGENRTKQYLIIGNGFDLAHEMLTKYEHFLTIMQAPDEFLEAAKKHNKKETVDLRWQRYFDGIDHIDLEAVGKMTAIINSNSWAKYYSYCGAEIEGWIDFEKEMLLPLNLFLHISNSEDISIAGTEMKPYTVIDCPSRQLARAAELWDKYFEEVKEYKDRPAELVLKMHYSDSQRDILKEKLLHDLRHELDEFIESFRLYIKHVAMCKPVEKIAQIEGLKADSIISFNYTCTEDHYTRLNHIHSFHVHGTANEKGSLVLGVNELIDDQSNEFIYFIKYFQRIRRHLNPRYRDLIQNTPYVLYIYGHSLDITDEDIIKPFIEKASHIIIFYHNDKDYENKVINLINMFDRQYVEENLFGGRINLAKSDGTVIK